jgi:5'-deoxynucleotidase YfbR-like HD superfamily hydrolase
MSNPWVQTQTGKAFDLVLSTVAMVDSLDIAVRLARANRFSGAKLRISVAQHSVMAAAAAWRSVSWAGCGAPAPVRRIVLLALHDAAETYIGDVFGPVRRLLVNMARELVAEYADSRAVMKTAPATYDLFGVLEDRILGVIYAACNVAPPTADEQRFVKEYDRLGLLDPVRSQTSMAVAYRDAARGYEAIDLLFPVEPV